MIHQVLQAISSSEKEGSRRIGLGSQAAILGGRGRDGDGEKGGEIEQEQPRGRMQEGVEDEDVTYGKAAAYMAGRYTQKPTHKPESGY